MTLPTLAGVIDPGQRL